MNKMDDYEGFLAHQRDVDAHNQRAERENERQARAAAEIEKDMHAIGTLRRALVRIQELATDVPEQECAAGALDAIYGECERALSDTLNPC